VSVAQTLKPPSTQRLYDVCVVGSQLGGAVAGALLARRGYRVLHVDHDGAGGSYDDGGYLLPWAPAVLPSFRLLPAAEAALGELGFTPDLGRLMEPAAPPLQILLPRNRLDVPVEPAQRMVELRREFRADAERLEGALAQVVRQFDGAAAFLKALPPLPPEGFGDRRALGKALRASGPGPSVDLEHDPLAAAGDHPFLRALRFAQRTLGYLDGPPPPLATARLLGGALRGTYRLPGGYEGLRDVLRRRIAEARGELLGAEGAPAVAEALELDGGKVVSVRLQGSANAYLARAFVVATDAVALSRLLPVDARRKIADLDAVHPRRELLTVNLVVKTAALPPALGETVVALARDDAGEGIEDAILVQTSPARRDAKKGSAGEAVPGERVVCAAGFVPADTRGRGDAHLAALAGRVRETLADLLPFFDRHLVRESIPALAAPADRRAQLAFHPLYAVEAESALGVTGLPGRALKNLVFAGREVVPGLGIEGEFHAGVQAANAAQGLLGRRDLLR
jgi:phytoene dehydrogenase-like protein